jgi:hypothetical protein
VAGRDGLALTSAFGHPAPAWCVPRAACGDGSRSLSAQRPAPLSPVGAIVRRSATHAPRPGPRLRSGWAGPPVTAGLGRRLLADKTPDGGVQAPEARRGGEDAAGAGQQERQRQTGLRPGHLPRGVRPTGAGARQGGRQDRPTFASDAGRRRGRVASALNPSGQLWTGWRQPSHIGGSTNRAWPLARAPADVRPGRAGSAAPVPPAGALRRRGIRDGGHRVLDRWRRAPASAVPGAGVAGAARR